MNKTLSKWLFVLALLSVVQGAWGWGGAGTSSDPYLIETGDDWTELAIQVASGSTFSGKYFMMSRDVSTEGIQVGSKDTPFSGTFDGDGHTLTYNKGSRTPKFIIVNEECAPFGCLDGAVIRHLRTAGYVVTDNRYNGGIAVHVDGQGATFLDCSSSIGIYSVYDGETVTGGLVGEVMSTCKAAPTFEKCMFSGKLEGIGTHWGGMVGWSAVSGVSFKTCMVDPVVVEGNTGATFIRLASGKSATFDECWCTQYIGTEQGTCLFSKVGVPEGCKWEMVEEPDLRFAGKSYWKSGAHVDITMPEGTAFHHWTGSYYPGVFISDPFRMNGKHQIQDVKGPVFLGIVTDDIPEAETERTLWGVTYRYLSRKDYHYFVSDETCKAKGWKFENDDAGDSNANLVVYDADGNASEITAVTGYDESDYNDDGVQIHNDLVSVWRAHTHLGLIAPRAFAGSSKLSTLYFKDTDASTSNALLPFDFIIGDEAFKDCPNLTEVKMMQYTTRGDNHWEALKASQVSSIGDDVFSGAPKARVSTHRAEYQDYMVSATWRDYRTRIIIYDATVEDFTAHGVKYHKYRNADETTPLTNAEKDQMLDNHLRIWNADYRQFSAGSLLDTKDDARVFYTYVVGVDDSAIDGMDGVMRIYNDPGEYYNYKTLALGRSAIAGNEHVKAIEFWQTNGRSENSYSDLKMVIQNGALSGCKNLKELRMFYFVKDGDDHWETLGPQDVIPGDNIFGEATADEITAWAIAEEYDKMEADWAKVPQDFKILVSPDRFEEFLNDPNWARYVAYIEAVDFDPQNQKKDITRNGLTYGYMTNPGGILQTSQVVSQDVSWWTVARILPELIIDIVTIGNVASSFSAISDNISLLSTALADVEVTADKITALETLQTKANIILTQIIDHSSSKTVRYLSSVVKLYDINSLSSLGITLNNPMAENFLIQGGLIDAGGVFLPFNQTISEEMYKLMWGTLKPYLTASIKQRAGLINLTKSTLENLAKLSAAKKQNAIIRGCISGSLLSSIPVASVLSSQCWGGSGSYNGDALQKGMRENIRSNIHQVGVVGGGYVITTPTKNLVYHNYIKEVADDVKEARIYAGFDQDGSVNSSNRTMTFAKNAFRNKTNLERVYFYENPDQTGNASMPMLLTIPDSAFVGCTALTEFSTLLSTKDNGKRALGPENFILAGDSIFAGLDPEKFHIVIDEGRRQDFLDNASWSPLEKYFVYENATPKSQFFEYGGGYAYAYENNSIKKENKVSGHLIEHVFVNEPDNTFLQEHQGALKLCNDIGTYNNYQLDYVARKAFYGNEHLRTVSFTDLYGFGATGDSYTDLDITLQDSCFAKAKNLADIDLVYLKTDGTNSLEPLRPSQVRIGNGVLDGTTAAIKMMPRQVEWFEADTAWAAYKNRFLPCIIKPADEQVYKVLKDMRYYDPAATGSDDYLWDDYIDLARIGGIGFSWLDKKFTGNKDIRSFGDFSRFEAVGLDYVGKAWFKDCSGLSNILLPSTVKDVQKEAFAGCASLKEIELPASLESIHDQAFKGCASLTTIVVKGDTPAMLSGDHNFPENSGLKIYVPAAKVNDYKKAWPEYAGYIVSDANYAVAKRITTTGVGQVAEKLGLGMVKESGKVRHLTGNYSKYDSLTVCGPVNGEDLAVIRHLAGADAYDSDPTDGRLRYLNLWEAQIRKDGENCYNGNYIDEYIDADDKVPDYIFENCASVETVILPESATCIGENIFEEATALRRVCVGRKTTRYESDILQDLTGIDEVVFLTEGFATSDSSDPWEAPIQQVFSTNAQLGNYLGDPALTRQAYSVTAPLEEDHVMWMLADNGHFFPSEYLEMENVEGIFHSNAITSFDDFWKFHNVRTLENTFYGDYGLESITLPDSLRRIEADAFYGCEALKTIRVSCDSVPELAEDAFRSLPHYFQILVPKRLCKLYREKWAQYASHINVDGRTYDGDDIITVTVTEPNTLAEKLGLDVTTATSYTIGRGEYVSSVRGDYSRVRRLKVVGPISGADLDVMRYMAGWCPWTHSRNYAGRLEYVDLYDADIRETKVGVLGYDRSVTSLFTREDPRIYGFADNVLPYHAFLRAYSLRTLILPRTCKEVEQRALQECEGLETLVIGDDMEDFNWNALDDDAMLTRMYILARKKLGISTEFPVWRWLCNNYNPTFDAFYVRPSTYEDYLHDTNYTGSSWQRTNNISRGVFDDDDSFCVFASHAAATMDDLFNVRSVDGWFKGHEGIRNLTPLGYTAIDSLHAADIRPLTKLEQVALPATLVTLEDSLFSKAPGLRYVDMLACDSADVIAGVRSRGFSRLGIDSLQTLVYLPQAYGEARGVNVVVAGGGGMSAETFRLVGDRDYFVPYAFHAGKVENSRVLSVSAVPYTVCLPYEMPKPQYGRVYQLVDRDGETLTFMELEPGAKMEALRPYLVKAVGNKRLRKTQVSLGSDTPQTIPASGGATFGQQVDVPGYSLRGTLGTVSNAEAADIGAYILQSDGDWYPVSATGTDAEKKACVLPFRAFLLPSAHNANGHIGMEMENLDDIKDFRTVDLDGTERVYDLSGRQVSETHRGIVIKNGKKMINQ